MRTFEVTFTDGGTETYYAERIQFGPTHIVFDNTPDSLGTDAHGNYNFSLDAALLASTVLMVEETRGASWRKRLQKAAWDEGFDAGEADAMDNIRNEDHDCTPNPYEEKK